MTSQPSQPQLARSQRPARRPSDKPESEASKGAASSERTCFVIAPIGDSESEVRKRSNQILKHVIKPVAQAQGYSAIRADHIDQSGSITSQVITAILNSEVVVADLTDHNPNVFYELALRHAAAKPFIQLIQTGQTIPFDISNYRTIFIDHRDLDSVADARQSLEAMFLEFGQAPDRRVDTPITQAVDFEGLRASGNPEQRELASIALQMRQLTNYVVRRRQTPEDDPDMVTLRTFLTRLASQGRLTADDQRALITEATSSGFDEWVRSLRTTATPDPWATAGGTTAIGTDPWATPQSEEPPF